MLLEVDHRSHEIAVLLLKVLDPKREIVGVRWMDRLAPVIDERWLERRLRRHTDEYPLESGERRSRLSLSL